MRNLAIKNNRIALNNTHTRARARGFVFAPRDLKVLRLADFATQNRHIVIKSAEFTREYKASGKEIQYADFVLRYDYNEILSEGLTMTYFTNIFTSNNIFTNAEIHTSAYFIEGTRRRVDFSEAKLYS